MNSVFRLCNNVLMVSLFAFSLAACSGAGNDDTTKEDDKPEEPLTLEELVGNVDLQCSPSTEVVMHCEVLYSSAYMQKKCGRAKCDEMQVGLSCEDDAKGKTSFDIDECIETKLPIVILVRECYAVQGYNVSNLIVAPVGDDAAAINACIMSGFDRLQD